VTLALRISLLLALALLFALLLDLALLSTLLLALTSSSLYKLDMSCLFTVRHEEPIICILTSLHVLKKGLLLNYMYCTRSCIQNKPSSITPIDLDVEAFYYNDIFYHDDIFSIMTWLLPVWSAQAAIYLHVFCWLCANYA